METVFILFSSRRKFYVPLSYSYMFFDRNHLKFFIRNKTCTVIKVHLSILKQNLYIGNERFNIIACLDEEDLKVIK